MENGNWNGGDASATQPSAAAGFDNLSEFRFGSPLDAGRSQFSSTDRDIRPLPAPGAEGDRTPEVKPRGGNDAASGADPVDSYYQRYQPLGPAPGFADDKPESDKPGSDPKPNPQPNPDSPQPNPDRPRPSPYRPQPNPYEPQPNPFQPQPGPDNPQPGPNPGPYPPFRPRPRPRPCPGGT